MAFQVWEGAPLIESYKVKVFPFGPSDIGKSSMLDFILTGKKPEGGKDTTEWDVSFSGSIVFYRRDWERVSKKMFGKVIPEFVGDKMSKAIPADQPTFKNIYLSLCNNDALKEDEKIIDLNEPYTIIDIIGPDTGGQRKYEKNLPQVAYSSRGHNVYPCFRNLPGHIEELKEKMAKVQLGFGKDYEWRGAYLQLQMDMDNKISEEQVKELKSMKDLPIYYISSKNMTRYELVDIFVIDAIKTK